MYEVVRSLLSFLPSLFMNSDARGKLTGNRLINLFINPLLAFAVDSIAEVIFGSA